MNEVKDREDEYEYVKDIASRLEGLAAPLAKRERRLLHEGPLFLASSDSRIGILESRGRPASGRRDQPAPGPIVRPVALQVFVFTDMVVLATLISTGGARDRRSISQEKWCIVAETGLSRIVGLTEHHSKAG